MYNSLVYSKCLFCFLWLISIHLVAWNFTYSVQGPMPLCAYDNVLHSILACKVWNAEMVHAIERHSLWMAVSWAPPRDNSNCKKGTYRKGLRLWEASWGARGTIFCQSCTRKAENLTSMRCAIDTSSTSISQLFQLARKGRHIAAMLPNHCPFKKLDFGTPLYAYRMVTSSWTSQHNFTSIYYSPVSLLPWLLTWLLRLGHHLVIIIRRLLNKLNFQVNRAH